MKTTQNHLVWIAALTSVIGLLSFPILSDNNREMIEAWGVVHPGGGMGEDIARPATFLLGPDGTIVWKSLTDNWRIRVRPEYLFMAIEKHR